MASRSVQSRTTGASLDKLHYESRGKARHGPLSVAFKAGPTPGTVNVRYLEVSKDGKLQAEIDLGGTDRSAGSPISFTPDGQTIVIGMTPAYEPTT